MSDDQGAVTITHVTEVAKFHGDDQTGDPYEIVRVTTVLDEQGTVLSEDKEVIHGIDERLP